MQRHVGNRMAWLFARSRLSKLSVIGRRTGRSRTTPVAVLAHERQRYLVSYRGESEWVRNLRAAGGRARLEHRGRVEEITVTEVPISERAPLLAAYTERYGRFPTVAGVLRALPDPADHPTFRIESRPRSSQTSE